MASPLHVFATYSEAQDLGQVRGDDIGVAVIVRLRLRDLTGTACAHLLLWRADRIRRRVEAEHKVTPYTDLAISRVTQSTGTDLDTEPEVPALETAAE